MTEVPVAPTAEDITPPRVTVRGLPEAPWSNLLLSFSATAEDADGVVTAVAYSLDDGATWHPVTEVRGLGTARATIGVTTVPLEEGTHAVIVRARDAAGHEGRSAVARVIVDRLPVILGGISVIQLSHPLSLSPGGFRVLNAPFTVSASFAGGVTDAAVHIGASRTALAPTTVSRVWSATVTPPGPPGRYALRLEARDGAENTLDAALTSIEVLPPFTILDAATGSPVTDATAFLERREITPERWVPVAEVPAPDGRTPLILPAGTWRLHVQAPGLGKHTTAPFSTTGTELLTGYVSLRRGLRPLGLPAVPILGRQPAVPAPPPTPPPPAAVGPFTDAAGQRQVFEEWRGRLVLLSLLTPWGRASLDELHPLDALQRAWGDRAVIAPVFVQTPATDLAALLTRGRYEFMGLADETGQAVAPLGTFSLPAHIVFDRRGTPRAALSGFQTQDALETLLRDVAAHPLPPRTPAVPGDEEGARSIR